jgi:hypothetical protein
MNIEHRTPINARPPLAGMMKWWGNKTSIFDVLLFKEIEYRISNTD